MAGSLRTGRRSDHADFRAFPTLGGPSMARAARRERRCCHAHEAASATARRSGCRILPEAACPGSGRADRTSRVPLPDVGPSSRSEWSIRACAPARPGRPFRRTARRTRRGPSVTARAARGQRSVWRRLGEKCDLLRADEPPPRARLCLLLMASSFTPEVKRSAAGTRLQVRAPRQRRPRDLVQPHQRSSLRRRPADQVASHPRTAVLKQAGIGKRF